MKRLDWICAAFAIMVWGVTFANTRALLLDFSPLEIHVIRFAVAWLALWGAAKATRTKAADIGWRDEALFAAMGLMGVVVYQLLENCAIYYTNASNVAILVSFGPIVTAALSRIFAKDRTLDLRMLVGSAVSICGVAVVSLNGKINFEMRPLGDFMALGAMFSWGVYSVLLGKANERGFPQIVVIRKTFFWALAMMLPLAVWGATESGFYALDGSFSVTLDSDINLERFTRPLNLCNLAFLGLLASAACFVVWNRACKALGVVRTTIGLYLTPIVGVVFAALFLGERLTALSACGGALIITGVIIATFRRTAK